MLRSDREFANDLRDYLNVADSKIEEFESSGALIYSTLTKVEKVAWKILEEIDEFRKSPDIED